MFSLSNLLCAWGAKYGTTNVVQGVFILTHASVSGFGTVYMGLEHAGRTLAKSLADETVQVVQHK